MTRYKIIILLILSSIIIHNSFAQDELELNQFNSSLKFKGSDINSKWVFTPDFPLIFPLYTYQNNFFDTKQNISIDRHASVGISAFKYRPNNNQFWNYKINYHYRSLIFGSNTNVLIEENNSSLDITFNKLLSRTKPVYLDIDRLFLGGGVSCRYNLTPLLEAYGTTDLIALNDLVNDFKVFGLMTFGYLEDLLNITKRSNLSILDVNLGFPIFSLSNNLKGNYQSLPILLEDYQKSSGSSIFITLRYNQYLDKKRNYYSNNYFNRADANWNDLIDPLKTFIPEIVRYNLPRKRYYGNIRISYDVLLKSNQLTVGEFEFDLINNSFNAFEIGYSLHYLGNHAKYYDFFMKKDNGLRFDLFSSVNYRSSFYKLNRSGERINNIDHALKFYSGATIMFSKSAISISGGAGYTVSMSNVSIGREKRNDNLDVQKSSFFLSLGVNNISLKFESFHNSFMIYNSQDIIDDFSLAIQIGL